MEKLKKIFEYIQLLKFTFPRLKANRIYRNIVTDRNSIHSQSVLCEGLWDHPYHWLRVAMLSKAMSESYPGNLIGISLKENPRIVLPPVEIVNPASAAEPPDVLKLLNPEI